MIKDQVKAFLNKWSNSLHFIYGLFSIAILAGSYLLYSKFHFSILLGLGSSAIGLSILSFFWYKSLPSIHTVINFLHDVYPELGHSLGITQKEASEYTSLDKLQLAKLDSIFSRIDLPPAPIKGFIRKGLITLVVSFGVLFITQWLSSQGEISNIITENISLAPEQEFLPSEIVDSISINSLQINVVPPSYTGIKSYTSRKPSIQIPEGSTVQWNIKASPSDSEIRFTFGESQKSTSAINQRIKQTFYQSSFYTFQISALNVESYFSPYYPVKVKEDSKPAVSIQGLPEYQKLPWKDDYKFNFSIQAQDDYGIEEAFLSATLAAGAGESVKFREKRYPLKNFIKNQKDHSSTFSFSTSDLEMEPGNELYFYVAAKDNCPFRNQITKSITHFIILEDTVQYLYADDAGMQVDLMPDFFRSQRQIIIDTKKLLQEKKEISTQEFNERSNVLGYDQKLLRLKYGQFLGEESESGIAIENEIEEDHLNEEGEDHDNGDGIIKDWASEVLEQFGHNHDHEAEANQKLENDTRIEEAKKPGWVEELSHTHDNAEENEYFDLSIKSKLKAALSVMWDSELHLRLYDPKTSLPFQYEALAYLEEIKNHARVYVHRIGFDPPTFKEKEKRLTGKLKDVISPDIAYRNSRPPAFMAIQAGIKILGKVHTSQNPTDVENLNNILQEAGNELAALAINNPSYLITLTKIQQVLNDPVYPSDQALLNIRTGLIRALPQDSPIIKSKEYVRHPLNKIAIESLSEL